MKIATHSHRGFVLSHCLSHWFSCDQWHFSQKADEGSGQWFSLGAIWPPPRGHMTRSANIFDSHGSEQGRCWHVVSRGHGCSSTPTMHRTGPTTKHYSAQNTSLRNPVNKGLEETVVTIYRGPCVHLVCQQLW